jgi:hypothetical protein
MFNWFVERLQERTSWDGVVLITAGLVVLFLGPWATYAAYAAIVWGLWTMWKKEN